MTEHEELKKYVEEMLRKLRMASPSLVDAIVQQLEEDPLLAQTLARIEARCRYRRR
ncbi:MAG: hypothetical protein QM817_30590 [Archangium sp.]